MGRPQYAPVLRELIQDSAVVEEFDHLSAKLRGMIDAAILEARGLDPTPGALEKDHPYFPQPTPAQPTLPESTSPPPTIPTTEDDGSTTLVVPGILTLLHAAQGSQGVSAAAITVDTAAIPAGLTALDTLLIVYTLEAGVGGATTPLFRHETDGGTLGNCSPAGSVPASGFLCGSARIRHGQTSGTRLITVTSSCRSNGGDPVSGTLFNSTTDWTAAWTLGLRVTVVPAGGSFSWQWQVYKVAGQQS